MYQALYRKYRPATFFDVVGQTAVTETLKNAISSGKISHAYLFTGTRGTGKTTCAKILAAAVNCENPKDGSPCMECEKCRAILKGATDIVEMDAASNNGVNDMRELKEQIAFLPTVLKYRVYIIDEVHMLSDSAFNALLKTLEEPPSHVIFILATTEVHKLPATILSRCQRYDFKRIDAGVIKERLLEVASKEEFNLEPTAAELIASLSDGGMRDALSILDQCSGCSENIDEALVTEICGMADNHALNRFVSAVANFKAEEALIVIDEVYSASVDMKRFCEDLLQYFRNILIIKTVKDNKKFIITTKEQYEIIKQNAEFFELLRVISIVELLSKAKDNMKDFAKRSEMELAAIRLCSKETALSLESLNERLIKIEENGITVKKEEKPLQNQKPQAKEENEAPKKEPVNEDDVTPLVEWPEILEEIKKQNMLLFGGLYGSKAYIKENRILIDSKLSQFREMVNSDPSKREIIKDAIKKVLNKAYNIGPYIKAKTEEDPLVAFKNSLNDKGE